MSIIISLTKEEFNTLVYSVSNNICDFYGECTSCPLDLKNNNDTCILIKLEKDQKTLMENEGDNK